MNRAHPCFCHVCGHKHTVYADQISSPFTVELRGVELPVRACSLCMMVPAAVRAAFERIRRGGPIIPPASQVAVPA